MERTNGNGKGKHAADERPKVSVIIATHNHAATIGDCIDSIWSRSFTGVEVIVVDVNSTDGTKEQLLEMAEDVEKVIIHDERHLEVVFDSDDVFKAEIPEDAVW